MGSFELIIMMALWVVLSLIVALQAARRGYNVWIWLLAGSLGNPLFFLVLLAIMPDFARKALRRKFVDELDQKLAALSTFLPVSDRLTEAAIASPVPTLSAPEERSVGDLPTTAPPQRSVEDEPTRL